MDPCIRIPINSCYVEIHADRLYRPVWAQAEDVTRWVEAKGRERGAGRTPMSSPSAQFSFVTVAASCCCRASMSVGGGLAASQIVTQASLCSGSFALEPHIVGATSYCVCIACFFCFERGRGCVWSQKLYTKKIIYLKFLGGGRYFIWW